ncbi:TPA: glycosyltransferase family 8 protein [Campylobacter jejuni]|nr:glycosyltransferase family 8 protein [Campylobacter jejuni]
MFHIILNLNDDYVKYASVLISSIVKNTDTSKTFAKICEENHNLTHILTLKQYNKSEEEGYVFHILSDFISDKTRMKLEYLKENLAKIYPCDIKIYIINEDNFRNFLHWKGNFVAYYRLMVGSILPPDIEKCLYIDADMLCFSDIRKLFLFDLEDKVLGAVADFATWNTRFLKFRKLKYLFKGFLKFSREYFNSGLLLIDLKEWRRQNIEKKCLDVLKYYKCILPDQDALNIVIKENYIKLPLSFNCPTVCYATNYLNIICKDEISSFSKLDYFKEAGMMYSKNELLEALNKPLFLHYSEKPWARYYFLNSNYQPIIYSKDVFSMWQKEAFEVLCFKEDLILLKNKDFFQMNYIKFLAEKLSVIERKKYKLRRKLQILWDKINV